MKRFEFLEHTADIKIRVYGRCLEDLFKNSSYALRKVVLSEKNHLKKESPKNFRNKKIEILGNDYKSLLYNFLEELIYTIDAEDFILKKIKKMKLKKFNINLEIIEEKFSNYKITNKVKSITYNDMIIKRDNKRDCFIGEFVLDV